MIWGTSDLIFFYFRGKMAETDWNDEIETSQDVDIEVLGDSKVPANNTATFPVSVL